MEVKGKIILVMDPKAIGQKGTLKQEFVIETPGQYPKKVCLSLWGEDKINKYDLQKGLEITASVDIESRESNGRWYTEIKAYKITWDKHQGIGIREEHEENW